MSEQSFKPGIYFIQESNGEIVIQRLEIETSNEWPDEPVWMRFGMEDEEREPDGKILSGPFTAAQLSAFPLLLEAAKAMRDRIDQLERCVGQVTRKGGDWECWSGHKATDAALALALAEPPTAADYSLGDEHGAEGVRP